MKLNQHSKQGGKKPFFATLDEAKQNCKSYYEANGQLRDCTCGTCPNHPQQQESWQDEFDKAFTMSSIGTFEYIPHPKTIKAFIQDLLDQKARQIKAFKIVKPQKDNGLTYPVGAVYKAYNDGLDDALKILKEE